MIVDVSQQATLVLAGEGSSRVGDGRQPGSLRQWCGAFLIAAPARFRLQRLGELAICRPTRWVNGRTTAIRRRASQKLKSRMSNQVVLGRERV
jgi:hypothetical protein